MMNSGMGFREVSRGIMSRERRQLNNRSNSQFSRAWGQEDQLYEIDEQQATNTNDEDQSHTELVVEEYDDLSEQDSHQLRIELMSNNMLSSQKTLPPMLRGKSQHILRGTDTDLILASTLQPSYLQVKQDKGYLTHEIDNSAANPSVNSLKSEDGSSCSSDFDRSHFGMLSNLVNDRIPIAQRKFRKDQ